MTIREPEIMRFNFPLSYPRYDSSPNCFRDLTSLDAYEGLCGEARQIRGNKSLEKGRWGCVRTLTLRLNEQYVGKYRSEVPNEDLFERMRNVEVDEDAFTVLSITAEHLHRLHIDQWYYDPLTSPFYSNYVNTPPPLSRLRHLDYTCILEDGYENMRTVIQNLPSLQILTIDIVTGPGIWRRNAKIPAGETTRVATTLSDLPLMPHLWFLRWSGDRRLQDNPPILGDIITSATQLDYLAVMQVDSSIPKIVSEHDTLRELAWVARSGTNSISSTGEGGSFPNVTKMCIRDRLGGHDFLGGESNVLRTIATAPCYHIQDLTVYSEPYAGLGYDLNMHHTPPYGYDTMEPTHWYLVTNKMEWVDAIDFGGQFVPLDVLEFMYEVQGESSDWEDGGRDMKLCEEAWRVLEDWAASL